jgi:glycosyltransferase involved in cell wall biosynthesis
MPFFSVPAAGEPARTRMLLLSYHFPPGSGAGALRWQKLARHAAEYGWGLDVVTQHPSTYGGGDASRLLDLPAGARVFGIQARQLLRDRMEDVAWSAWRSIRRLRLPAPPPSAETLFRNGSCSRQELQDWTRVLREPKRAYHAWTASARDWTWARAAAAHAREVLDPSVHRAVVTCGPPHMVHEAGRRLAAAAGLPLIMDMRDPWGLVQRLPGGQASPLWYWLADRFEQRAVSAAALVVTNSEPAQEAMQSRYPEHADRIIAVANGVDDDPVPVAPPQRRFTIAYAGTIYLDRNPRLLFRAAGQVARELGLGPAEFGIELMGSFEGLAGGSLQEMAAEEGLHGFVEVHPTGNRDEALQFLARAALLVSLPQDSSLAIPSKIFEYMQFEAWLLVLAEPGSAPARLLAGSDADVVHPRDLEHMVRVIHDRYLRFRAEGRPQPLAREPRFSRREQARILFDALAALTDGYPAPAPEAPASPSAVTG